MGVKDWSFAGYITRDKELMTNFVYNPIFFDEVFYYLLCR